MKKIFFILFLSLFLFSCGKTEDSNARLKYWSMWWPDNCRALIKSNIDWFNRWEYTAIEALNSINRNCWENWSLWVESIWIHQNQTNPFAWTLAKKQEEDTCEAEVEEAISETEERMRKMYEAIDYADKQVQARKNTQNNNSKELKVYNWYIIENVKLRKEAWLNSEVIKIIQKEENIQVTPEARVLKDWYEWTLVTDYHWNTWWAIIDYIKIFY